jgi:hypothetical protein
MHRTITFYLGLFPMVILLWAWADSRHFHTRFLRNSDDSRQACVGIEKAALYFTTMSIPRDADTRPFGPRGPFPPTGIGDFLRREIKPRITASGVPGKVRWLAPYEHYRSEMTAAEVTLTTTFTGIPFWLILAAYLPLWLGLSYWRSSRIKKRLQQSLPGAAADHV